MVNENRRPISAGPAAPKRRRAACAVIKLQLRDTDCDIQADLALDPKRLQRDRTCSILPTSDICAETDPPIEAEA